MAIYHFSIKTISRSFGRSATAAAAYRSCEKISCERQGIIHDYRNKRGLISSEIIAPKNAPSWVTNREILWNKVEERETRKNSTVAREFEVALPAELNIQERKKLASDFSKELVDRYGFVADICIHDDHDNNKNHHAHILCTTRTITEEGFTNKTRTLDEKTSGDVEYWRERWAELVNQSLGKNGHATTVDHRTLKVQGIDRKPTKHLGSAAIGYERRTGNPSDVRQRTTEDARERERLEKEIVLEGKNKFLATIGLLSLPDYDNSVSDLEKRFAWIFRWTVQQENPIGVPPEFQEIVDHFTANREEIQKLDENPRTKRFFQKAIESIEALRFKALKEKLAREKLQGQQPAETQKTVPKEPEKISATENPPKQPLNRSESEIDRETRAAMPERVEHALIAFKSGEWALDRWNTEDNLNFLLEYQLGDQHEIEENLQRYGQLQNALWGIEETLSENRRESQKTAQEAQKSSARQADWGHEL